MMDRKLNHYDVIIVGTGAAGLFCALHLPRSSRVLMITKDKLENSDSYLAQGGICCLLGEEDYDSYYEDTMKAGHYENSPEAVSNMIRNSRHIIRELIRFGVDFDRKPDGRMDFTREGGHSQYRILHHQDVTGREIVTKLIARVKERPNITIREYLTMIDVLEADNRCYGIVARDEEDNEGLLTADAVVLATGGLGGLFSQSTNFPHITGDSFAIALRHHIQLKNLSYIQIHPTVLYSKKPGRRFLISESVRGEGAKLLNEDGERFTDELQPRDVVAAAIKREMDKFGTDHVYLSFRDIPEDVIRRHFPNIYTRCLEEGYDITRESIPVVPAQHYLMGGIQADTRGRTSMQDLYAIGETACNGVHGANRLASNSLLESLVFAENAAAFIHERQGCEGQAEAALLKTIEEELPETYEEEDVMESVNKGLLLEEIRKQGTGFYEKWRDL